MRVQPIKNSYPSHKGVYYVSTGSVFLKELPKEAVDCTTKGIRYIKDNNISEGLKTRFEMIPFIQNLSKNGDVFIHYKELPKDKTSTVFQNYLSTAKIIWTDYTKQLANAIFVSGFDKESQCVATENLLNNIKQKKFNDVPTSLQKIFI